MAILRTALLLGLGSLAAACMPQVSSDGDPGGGGGGGEGGGGEGGGGGPDGGGGVSPDAGPPLPAGVYAIPLSGGGFEYDAPLTVGGQTFLAQVDTGSTSAAVASSKCTTCGVTAGYTPGSTATDTKKTASTTYGDNSKWSGEIYKDTASTNGTPDVSLDFVSITSQTGFFGQGALYQGILGLGGDGMLEPGTTSYMDATVKAGVTNQMAFQMCPDGGTMWLGGFDPNAATAAPTYVPMNAVTADEPWYTVDIAEISVGGTNIGIKQAGFGEALVDTGTSVALVPTAAETALVNAINASAGFKQLFGTQKVADGGCVTAAGVTGAQVDAALPKLGIEFPGGGKFSLDPTRSYMLPQGSGQFCFVFSDSGDNTMSVIGDTLLASFETVFDVDHNRIGFAPQAGCIEADAAPAVVARTQPRTFGPGLPWWHDEPTMHLPPHVRPTRQ